ncbi:hypothetical protein CAT59_07520 [Acinetobacter pittii]|uniref:Uncharacterized protein n=1 Tax=Acinetobacter pittii TaxID=48296 RepID=A0A242U5Q1_ACIPI|nr:hypothetical protein [Acinetobacter pittii]OTU28400.1 hypothetical protein CAT59_07520 [Acinetobacter pittii]
MLSKLLNLKKQIFSKINLLKVIPYALTFIYLIYISYICFLAEPDDYSWSNVGIKSELIDFGGFGSLLAGIFSPLAFLWLLLTFRQTDKNLHIAQKQLMILEEKEINRKKLIKPIFSDIESRVFPSIPHVFCTYTIEFSVIGEVNRIFPIVKSDPQTFKINKKVRPIVPDTLIDGFPYNKSFKDENCKFHFQINPANLSGNEIFEIELHYLDKDGNDHVTTIYVKYIQLTRNENGKIERIDNNTGNIKVTFDRSELT